MKSLKNFRHIALYATSLAVLVFALKWLQWKFLIVDNSLDIYIGLIAVFFTILGVWVATHLSETKVQTILVEKQVYVNSPSEFTINEAERKRLGLSNREYEVLNLLAIGQSNADIADTLYLSISTVKTHVSKLYTKMGVQSRTQAIQKAKELKIIA